MKSILMAFMLATVIPSTHAQWNPESSAARDGVTTTGEAEIRVPPDQVEISLGVETRDGDVGKARELNDQDVDRVIAAATRHGVDAAHIKTDYVNIEPGYDWQAAKAAVYVVRKSLVITSVDIAGFDALLADLVKSGANHVHNVRFVTTDLRKHRDEARKLAAIAAREKAELLARTLGVELGRAKAIAEASDDWRTSYGWWWGWNNAPQSQNVVQTFNGPFTNPEQSGIAPGQISVRARVTVTFELR